MKRKYSLLWIAIAAFTFASCSNKSANEEQAEETTQEVYSYDANTTQVGFTAYKFNEKKGVSGTFDIVEITNDSENENPLDVISGMKFSIPITSINTNDEGRDGKILKFFFGTIKTETITGEVLEINDDNNTLTLSINMNGIDYNTVGEYTLNGNEFSFDADIDVTNWDAMSGIDALNKECYDLHKGTDGVSKLWPDVSISFKTTLAKK